MSSSGFYGEKLRRLDLKYGKKSVLFFYLEGLMKLLGFGFRCRFRVLGLGMGSCLWSVLIQWSNGALVGKVQDLFTPSIIDVSLRITAPPGLRDNRCPETLRLKVMRGTM